jgi:type IV pilus assembly protein PilO
MAMTDTVKSWPWYGQALLFAIIAGILVYIGFKYMVEPINLRMATLNKERESLIQEINKGETLKARSIEFEAESKRLETQLESLKRILPESEEIADLYSRIQQEGNELGLTITNFKPGAHVAKEYYDEWPISMSVNGSYHILAKFFERLGKLYRIINVNDFTIKQIAKGKGASSNTISATCIATTFIYREKPPETGKSTKKGGRS